MMPHLEAAPPPHLRRGMLQKSQTSRAFGAG
jgi:hypothetical protein